MSASDALTRDLGGSADRPRPRPSARILLLDTSDRLLLFHATGVIHGDDSAFWFTPGGALEPGESWEDAARRELWEETGLETAELSPCVWTRSHVFRWEGVWFDSRERFFVARTEPFTLAPAALERWEVDSVRDHYWWRPDEIEAARDQVFVPRALAVHLERLLRGPAPESPIDVGV
jgi:8-oxo-dGTP pyrophosphatase MutT (NUDIX family)